jgi:uncharacterized iron-regulated protein
MNAVRNRGSVMALLVALVALVGVGNANALQLLDLASGRETSLRDALPEILKKQIVLVGESHDEPGHHQSQLKVIQALVEAGAELSIGLEMFQQQSQSALDQWVRGELTQSVFEKTYRENWNLPWQLYGEILEYAKAKQIPLVGLNVSREITAQVARHGFASLTAEQRARLPFVECRVDREYMEFVRRAYGAHAHGHMSFSNFCEAQLVWDRVMALNALKYLAHHPHRKMVILAGSGHVWKEAIPHQLRGQSSVSFAVMLPWIEGSIDRAETTVDDADYLILLK